LNIPCNVILDLIPLVKDGVASDDSNIIVNEHIKACTSCKSEFETLDVINPIQSSIKDKKIISAMKRNIFVTQIIILIAGGFLGVALSNSMGMFYNFMIMPIVGGVSVVALKRKWYLTPIVIFIVSYLWTTISELVLNGFEWIFLYNGLYYGTIYTVLVLLGVLIAMLFKITFKKER
jgi:hypothetical protein